MVSVDGFDFAGFEVYSLSSNGTLQDRSYPAGSGANNPSSLRRRGRRPRPLPISIAMAASIWWLSAHTATPERSITFYNISILPGTGNGEFQPPQTININATFIDSGVDDFNGDGKLDPALGSTVGRRGVQGVVSARRNLYQRGYTFVTVGDFNGNGTPDLAVTGEAVVILLGNGDGTFQVLPGTGLGRTPSKMVAVADFNADGIEDLAVAYGHCGDVAILLGNGDGTFQSSVNYPVRASGAPVAALNADGTPDLPLLCGDHGFTIAGTVSILVGNADGAFQSGPLYFGGNSYWLVAGDFDNDGKPDLAIASYNIVNLLMNTTPKANS